MISAFRLLNGEVAVIRRPKDGEEGIIRTRARLLSQWRSGWQQRRVRYKHGGGAVNPSCLCRIKPRMLEGL